MNFHDGNDIYRLSCVHLLDTEAHMLTRREIAYAATATLTLWLTGCSRKPVGVPMPTDGPNQYVFAVPEMT